MYGIALLIWALLVVGHWKMFDKAGEKGWKAIIPLYSDYTLFKLVWTAKSFWIYVAAAVGSVAFNLLSGQYAVVGGQLVIVGDGNFFLNILAFIAGLILLLYTVLLQVKTSLAYGKGMVFAAGLLFLPNIFTLILGFGSATYKGPQY
ncbi:MAG: DUF5684 domain-containing protein [Coriobacteriales bacterium]|nr:DUF5684 domain-containing protein [Coriobacteriales bacterium]